MAAGLAVALAVGLAVAYSSERRRANDLEEAATALDDQAALTGAAAASETVSCCSRAACSIWKSVSGSRTRAGPVLAASRRETRQQLRRSRDDLESERARFQSFMGPAVADGTHVGKLVAVGASQVPARLITDLGRWFTGRAATQAAIADDAIRPATPCPATSVTSFHLAHVPGRSVGHGHAFRRWNGKGTYTISLDELQRLSNSESRRPETSSAARSR